MGEADGRISDWGGPIVNASGRGVAWRRGDRGVATSFLGNSEAYGARAPKQSLPPDTASGRLTNKSKVAARDGMCGSGEAGDGGCSETRMGPAARPTLQQGTAAFFGLTRYERVGSRVMRTGARKLTGRRGTGRSRTLLSATWSAARTSSTCRLCRVSDILAC